MNIQSRLAITALAAAVALTACNKIEDKDAAKADDGVAKTAEDAGKLAIPGLKTEKEQISYTIGVELGRSLKPIEGEIDFATVSKAAKAVLDDGKLLITDEQAKEISQAFGVRMQQKQMEEMQANAKKNTEAGEKFFAENGKKPGVVTTASGLQYQIETEGKGAKPTAKDIVRVHYKGALLDGTTFDSSYDRGEPAVFGLSDVVPGWQEGIALMPVGSKFKLWIPGKLGYGEQGTPGGPIQPNATLVFDVELLDIVKPGEQGAAPAAR